MARLAPRSTLKWVAREHSRVRHLSKHEIEAAQKKYRPPLSKEEILAKSDADQNLPDMSHLRK